jgi:methylthioribulose-1-phosphate dehydratase
MISTQLTPASFPDEAQQLVDVCHFLGARNLAPATGGNFSVRVDEEHFLITQSGRDKSQLSRDDLMLCELSGKALEPGLRPSAETGLHSCLYQLESNIGAVLHTHSVTSTVLSRATIGDLQLHGFEMQKALAGNLTHEGEFSVAIFDNDQDISALAEKLKLRWLLGTMTQPGFLVRGHGLYAWGKDLAEARRHIEGFEFLFACAWQEKCRETR